MAIAENTKRRRVTSTLTGAVAVLLIIPYSLSTWSPGWFTAAWTILFLMGAFGFCTALFFRENEWNEFVWSICLAVLFAALPLSTIVFDDAPASVWGAVALVAFFITNEIASRNFVQRGDWRVGPIIAGVAIAVAVTVQLQPLFGVGVMLTALTIIRNAQDIQDADAEMRHQRNHDELTGLLSRRGLFDQIEAMPAGPKTMVLVDADRFKTINDTYGYTAGDALLRSLGEALTDRLGSRFQIGRQGGDEFVAIAPGRVPVAANLTDPVSARVPFRDGHLDIEARVSAGVVEANDDIDPLKMLSWAGFAVRSAKRSQSGISRFDGQLKEQFARALEVWEARGLPDTDSLFAEAQMITNGHKVVGWELLARWRGEDGAIVLPPSFLPLLAENGLMPDLNDRMLETAVMFAARFNDLDDPPFVSVNITASHLANPELVPYVASLLKREALRPEHLMIEITESEDLDALATWKTTARGLVDLGVGLAIDDFGAGYSSIQRINQLPITHLKFDRSLIASIEGPLGEILEGVVRFARRSGFGIIAEGLETADEHTAMRQIGVELFQGWLFGKAMPLVDAERRSRAESRRGPSQVTAKAG